MDIYEQLLKRYKKKCPHISEEDLLSVLSIANIKEYKKGELLSDLDKFDTGVYVIMKGLVKFYYYDKEGNEVVIEFNEEGDLIGNFYSSLMGKPSELCIEARVNTVAVKFDFFEFEKIADNNLALLRCYKEVLKERLSKAYQIIWSRMNEKPEERYLKMLDERGDLLARVSKKEIASYLGITPGSLSRMKKRIEETE